MRQTVLAQGSNPQEFVDNYNELLSELSRFTILREQQISDLSVLIYYETPNEVDEKIDAVEAGEPVDYTVELADPETEQTAEIVIKIVAPVPSGRYCCECEHYNWGKSCPYSEKHVRHMNKACAMFSVNIEGRCF